MMDIEELQALQGKFRQGVEKLTLLGECLEHIISRHGLDLRVEGIDEREGEMDFWFAGTRYYVRVRLTDRSVGDVGAAYSVPIGWLDWGRYNSINQRQMPEQTNYYDERGILCELDKEEFYFNLQHCDEERLLKGFVQRLQRLVGRTIAMNNVQSP